ncbi:MAG: SpoIID/LytB domain-containing protein [Erysipelotrichia bacterium]|nr:SpoIID/LytB domain-containing protein [Erysipelotrichia bacterium]
MTSTKMYNFFVRCLLAILLVACTGVEASYLDASRIVRVGLTKLGTPQSFTIEPSTGFIELFNKSKNQAVYSGKAATVVVSIFQGGKIKVAIDNRKSLYYESSELLFSPLGKNPLNLKIKAGGKKSFAYRGTISVIPDKGGLLAVNLVDIEDYLKSVVPSEISTRSPDAAQEAQAIAARTYAIRNLFRHGQGKYQVCDTVHCQVYPGIVKEIAAASRAVKRTEGQILSFSGSPANTVYHSNCGGYLISSKAAWSGTEIKYLSSHFDGISGQEPFCSYGIRFRKNQPTGKLPAPAKDLIAKPLPWNTRKLHHKNFGHRVGMCQDGAIGMGAIGYSARQILAFYYPGTRIETLNYAVPGIKPHIETEKPLVVAMKPAVSSTPLEGPFNPTQISTLTRNSRTNRGKSSLLETLKSISNAKSGSAATGIRKMFWTPAQPGLSRQRNIL